ncbi:hypothetical protein [Sediminibacter sp. Hel_I_10]|uniref:hypothetical protein n=1 Tax=Sediminibacter sp. Hel_I_10 TaxID=1392490 RepID=UPI00047E132B|nr:hypothetical protein [Sediminibacter sp. Hel_I_10]
MDLLERIQKLPKGYSEVTFQHKTYGVTRTDFNAGKSIKMYAEELGGTNVISLNIYLTSKARLIKPCEMPMEKVIHFLNHYQLKTLRS